MHRVAAAALIVAALVLPAGRSEGSQSELFALPLEDLLKIEYVYGVSKFEQKTTEAPSSVTIITADEIARFGYETLADLLGSVRSFHPIYDRNYNMIGVRGFSRPADTNSRILVLIDGHPQNDNVWGSIGAGYDFPLDLGVVDKVEVIRGPGSTLYGTSALFAVVNVITKPAADLAEPYAAWNLGSFETWGGQFGIGGSLRPGWKAAFRASILTQGGQDHYFAEFDDPSTNFGLAEGADGLDALRLFGRLDAGDFAMEWIHGSRQKRIPTASYESVFNDSRELTRERHSRALLTYSHTLSTASDVRVQLAYNDTRYDGDYPYDASEGDEPVIVVNKDRARGRWLRGEAHWIGRRGHAHTTTAGLSGVYSLESSQSNFDPDEVYVASDRREDNGAVFLQHEARLHPKAIATLGIRHDRYEGFGGATSPRAAVILAPRPGTSAKLLFGRAFRAPNLGEMELHDGNITSKPSPRLRAETIQTHEGVLEQYFRGNTLLAISVFTFDLRDLVTLTTDPADGLLVYKNLDTARSKGAEIELSKEWESGLSGRASYGYQETIDGDTREILINAPRQLAKLRLFIPVRDARSGAGLEVVRVGARHTLTGSTLDAYTLANLTLTQPFVSGHVDFSASIYNLLDTEYADAGSEEHVQDALLQDGRRFFMRIACAF